MLPLMENLPVLNTISIISFSKKFCLLVLAVLGLGCYVGFSLVLESRGYSLYCTGFSLRWLLLSQSLAFRAWASVAVTPGSRAQTQ